MLGTLLLAVALAAGLLLPGTAAAHTRLESTSPAAGDTVAGVREVRMLFSGPVEPRLTTLELRRGDGAIAAGELRAVAESEGREYVFPLPEGLSPGRYTGFWRTVGGDGHVISGSFAFTVVGPPAAGAANAPGAEPPPAEDATVAPPRRVVTPAAPLPVAIRWGWFLSLLGMVGAVGFHYGILPRLQRTPELRVVAARAGYGAWYVAAAAAALSVLTLLGRLWVQSSALGTDGWGGEEVDVLLLGTQWGLAWTLQAIATVGFFLGLLISRAPYGRAAGWMGAAAGATLLCTVPALSGHAVAVERAVWLAILSDTLHVLGAGLWLGTLATVLAAGLPAAFSAGREVNGPAVAEMFRAFSPLALAGAGVAAATGVVSALFHLSTPAELWSTGYGWALLLKLGLLGGVAALGYHNWRRVLPGLGGEPAARRLRRSAGAEVALAAAVLLVTAVLVALPTP